MKPLKICDGCHYPRRIWKREGRKCWCQACWNAKKCKELTSVAGKKQTTIKTWPKKRTSISPKSKKRQQQDLLYRTKREKFLVDHPVCQAQIQNLCLGYSGEIHHKAGKIGELYLDENNFLAICRPCHTWVTDHPKEAVEMGLSKLRLQTYYICSINLKQTSHEKLHCKIKRHKKEQHP